MIQNFEHCVVLHVTGPDRPGVTATLSSILAQQKGSAALVDIGQSVVHGYLSLTAVVHIDPGCDALRRILVAVSNLGLRVEVSTFHSEASLQKEKASGAMAASLCVTMLGELSNGVALAHLTEFLASQSLNISDIKTLSEGFLQGLELIVEIPLGTQSSRERLEWLRVEILKLSSLLKLDLAVQRNDVFRRNKRLVCMDVDSTFVEMEVIDELAALAGCKEKVADITRRAMEGEFDFKQALRERVACLKGLDFGRAQNLLQNIPLAQGSEALVNFLRTIGVKVGLVSGGFDFFVDHLKDRFKLDFAFANKLEVVEGKLTGKLVGSLVDPERKAQVLTDMSKVFKCRTEQTVAIGDGANDLLMLEAAGLGVAFKAKARLKEMADLSISYAGLDAILFLMGYRSSDVQRLSGLSEE